MKFFSLHADKLPLHQGKKAISNAFNCFHAFWFPASVKFVFQEVADNYIITQDQGALALFFVKTLIAAILSSFFG